MQSYSGELSVFLKPNHNLMIQHHFVKSTSILMLFQFLSQRIVLFATSSCGGFTNNHVLPGLHTGCLTYMYINLQECPHFSLHVNIPKHEPISKIDIWDRIRDENFCTAYTFHLNMRRPNVFFQGYVIHIVDLQENFAHFFLPIVLVH